MNNGAMRPAPGSCRGGCRVPVLVVVLVVVLSRCCNLVSFLVVLWLCILLILRFHGSLSILLTNHIPCESHEEASLRVLVFLAFAHHFPFMCCFPRVYGVHFFL